MTKCMPGIKTFRKVALHFPPFNKINLNAVIDVIDSIWNRKPQVLGNGITHVCNTLVADFVIQICKVLNLYQNYVCS